MGLSTKVAEFELARRARLTISLGRASPTPLTGSPALEALARPSFAGPTSDFYDDAAVVPPVLAPVEEAPSAHGFFGGMFGGASK